MTYDVGPRRCVVDASVVLKWQFGDEDDVAQALALRDAFLVDHAVELHAPVLLAYELTSAMRTAERRARVPAEMASEALDNMIGAGIALHEPAPSETLRLARRLGVSGYDAAYVALAAELGVECWSADERLVRAASPHVSFVRAISEYASR
ncbi:MAG: type II toxin-antitoxin system VapC family toxin [Chloroflexi bacterium]|nr:type II toxin-antitoxin system VapC family toxin [Chloroflexota bacterium]